MSYLAYSDKNSDENNAVRRYRADNKKELPYITLATKAKFID